MDERMDGRTDGPTDRGMDQWTNGWTNRPSYTFKDARTHLKIMVMNEKGIAMGEKAMGDQCATESMVQAKKQAVPAIRRAF